MVCLHWLASDTYISLLILHYKYNHIGITSQQEYGFNFFKRLPGLTRLPKKKIIYFQNRLLFLNRHLTNPFV